MTPPQKACFKGRRDASGTQDGNRMFDLYSPEMRNRSIPWMGVAGGMKGQSDREGWGAISIVGFTASPRPSHPLSNALTPGRDMAIY